MTQRKKAVSRRKPRKNAKITDLTKRHIIEGIHKGESVRAIQRELGLSSGAIFDLIGRDQDFAKLYAHAKEVQAQLYADRIHERVEELKRQVIDKVAETNAGQVELDSKQLHALVQVAKLDVDALKWTASKLAPKSWGDRVEHTGTIEHKTQPLIIYSREEYPDGPPMIDVTPEIKE